MKKTIIPAILAGILIFTGCTRGYISDSEKVPEPAVRRSATNSGDNKTQIIINPETSTGDKPVTQPAKTSGTSTSVDSKNLNSSTTIATKPVSDTVIGKVSEYFPLIENSVFYYKNKDGNAEKRYIQYTRYEGGKDSAQLRISGSSIDVVSVVEVTPEAVKMVYQGNDISYRENIIGRAPYNETILLKAPIVTGNKWETGGFEAEIISTDTKVEFMDKKLDAIVVRMSNLDKGIKELYFVKNIGLFKVVETQAPGNPKFHDKPIELLTFNSLLYNQSEKYTLKFWFPEKDGSFSQISKDMYFNTNDVTRMMIKDLYAKLALENGKTPVLTDDSKIQFFFIKDGAVHVDLNSSFISYVNNYPNQEKMILTALVKTMTDFYKSNRVYISVNDQRYESNSLKIEKWEQIYPDGTIE